MGDELKWLLKEGGGHVFESCDISLEIRPPHTQLVKFYLWVHASLIPRPRPAFRRLQYGERG